MPSAIIKFATQAVTLSGLFLALTACSPTSGDSLLTDQKADSSSLTLDKAPKQQELYLKANGVTLNPGTATKAELSGECYTSTYPKHDIIVTKAGTQIEILDISGMGGLNTWRATCRNGRFNFSINAGALAASAQHKLRVTLRAYETQNSAVPIQNDTQGAINVTLTK